MFGNGDKVECIDASRNSGIDGGLRVGAIYTVAKCKRGVWLRELETPFGFTGFNPKRFCLPEPKTDISIFTAMLRNIPQKELASLE